MSRSKLDREIAELRELMRVQGLLNTSPLYHSRQADEDDATVLDRLVAAGRITDGDRERVEFIVRVQVTPPEREEESIPSSAPADDIFGADTRKPERFHRRLEYPALGIV